MDKRKLNIVGATLVLALICSSCGLLERKERLVINMPQTSGEIGSIDIRSKEYFWLLRPWKEGTLATIDGWGQFSELTFSGADKIQIIPLVKFPKMQMDRVFEVWSEANLIHSSSAKMMHIADIETGFTKSFIPYLTWRHHEPFPYRWTVSRWNKYAYFCRRI